MLYRYAIDFVRNKIQFAQRNQLNDVPYISILPGISLKNQIEYSSYAQFISLYTNQESTPYEYSISANDQNLWFPVYFIPSKEQLTNYLNSEPLDYYLDEIAPQIFIKVFMIFVNISKRNHVLVMISDILNQSLTKINVNLHEKI